MGRGGGPDTPSAAHNHSIVKVLVHVLRGEGLISCDINGASDPFVKVLYAPQRHGVPHTTVKQKSLDPKWDFVEGAFLFDPVAGEDTVNFQVWDKDFGRSSDFMGQGRAELPGVGRHVVKVALVPRPGNHSDEKKKKKNRGSLGHLVAEIGLLTKRDLLALPQEHLQAALCNVGGSRTADSAHADTSVDSQLHELSRIEETLDDLRAYVKASEEQVVYLEQSLKELKDRLERNEGSVQEQSGAINDLRTAVQEAVSEIGEVAEATEKRTNVVDERVGRVGEEVGKLKQQLGLLHDTFSASSRQWEHEATSLHEELNGFSRHLQDALYRISSAESKISFLEQELGRASLSPLSSPNMKSFDSVRALSVALPYLIKGLYIPVFLTWETLKSLSVVRWIASWFGWAPPEEKIVLPAPPVNLNPPDVADTPLEETVSYDNEPDDTDFDPEVHETRDTGAGLLDTLDRHPGLRREW
eukprot:Sspe_Gene.10556::Locus_3533_Transcript_1_8_Confidence_0.182_Length_1793::g.10556::m.10556